MKLEEVKKKVAEGMAKSIHAQHVIALAVNNREENKMGDFIDNWQKLTYPASYWNEPASVPAYANKLEETLWAFRKLRALPISNELNARTCVVLWNPAEAAEIAANAELEAETASEVDTDPETLFTEMAKTKKK